MPSDRLAIQNKIVTLLQGITKANGYHNDVRLVTKKFLDIAAVTSFPVITVQRQMEMKAWASADEVLHLATVGFSIIGYIESVSDAANEGRMNDVADELEEDIQECLLKNSAQLFTGTQAKNMIVSSVRPELVDGSNETTVGIALAIQYYHTDEL